RFQNRTRLPRNSSRPDAGGQSNTAVASGQTNSMMSKSTQPGIGTPIDRIDGIAKVTGKARYAAEYQAEGLLYGVAVCAGVTQGRIHTLETALAKATPGVIEVLTHQN